MAYSMTISIDRDACVLVPIRYIYVIYWPPCCPLCLILLLSYSQQRCRRHRRLIKLICLYPRGNTISQHTLPDPILIHVLIISQSAYIIYVYVFATVLVYSTSRVLDKIRTAFNVKCFFLCLAYLHHETR